MFHDVWKVHWIAMAFYKPIPALSLLIILFLLIGVSVDSFSQEYKRANIWYFGKFAGLDFNSGSPVALTNSKMDTREGCASISDEDGNLLFYTNGFSIWNKNHQIMDNGTGLLGHQSSTQSAIIVPLPGSDSLYYVFTVPDCNQLPGNFHYSIVDISQNNGDGKVTAKNIFLLSEVTEKVTAVSHSNGNDIWVITHKRETDAFHSFLVTSLGVNISSVVSNVGSDHRGTDNYLGYLKSSPNGEQLACVLHEDEILEVFNFDQSTGHITNPITIPCEDQSYGVEFSQNGTRLYLGEFFGKKIIQYNLNAGTPINIINSAVDISGILPKAPGALQLGPDHRIYITMEPCNWLAVIREPNELGSQCSFLLNGVFLDNKLGELGLPTFIQSIFSGKILYDNVCFGDTTFFEYSTSSTIQSIIWIFGDPASGTNNISTLLQPSHVFSSPGQYTVSTITTYNNSIYYDSLDIMIHETPEPDLGPDTSICNGGEIELNAECGPHIYSWSTGAFGSSQITVSDTGWYWVRVESDMGCVEFDSLYLSFHNTAFADTTNLIVSPTTCGGSTGAIIGLIINGITPLGYQWLDDLGNPVSTSLDIYHLQVGNYTLIVTDGNDCINSFGPYSIIDAGDVLIDSVDYTIEHCGQQDASIIVTAVSGLGDMLFYSIDNGATYYNNQGIFTGLAAGNYAVRVRDSSDCQDVYINNPLLIPNTDAPEITDVQIGACSSGQSNGSIAISALGGGDTLLYSNDNGTNFQINDGGFFNLVAGFYTCVVMDEVGCDTTFIVEVPEEVTIHLQAVAGDDEVCPGNAAFVPLYVSNFIDVANFKTTLLYDKNLLTCTGFANAHIQLEDSLDATLFLAEGKVELAWHSSSLSLPDNTSMADLVFESLESGISMVDWDGSAGASLFQNYSGLTIPVDYFLDSVRIYQEVVFSLGPDIEACQGGNLEIIPTLLSSNGEVNYLWTEPSGSTNNNETLTINNAQQYQSGTYSLRLTDTLDCFFDTSLQVLIHPDPVPAFAGQDTITTEDPIELDAGDNYVSYAWSTGETDQYITADYNDWYSVVIESAMGCYGEDSVYVFFQEPIEDQLIVPNAFTPNGDGLNDEFKILGTQDNLTSFKMNIFNRWGQMVFESKDVTKSWDGTIKGADAPAGTYVFRVEYAIANREYNASGTIVLVR